MCGSLYIKIGGSIKPEKPVRSQISKSTDELEGGMKFGDVTELDR